MNIPSTVAPTSTSNSLFDRVKEHICRAFNRVVSILKDIVRFFIPSAFKESASAKNKGSVTPLNEKNPKPADPKNIPVQKPIIPHTDVIGNKAPITVGQSVYKSLGKLEGLMCDLKDKSKDTKALEHYVLQLQNKAVFCGRSNSDEFNHEQNGLRFKELQDAVIDFSNKVTHNEKLQSTLQSVPNAKERCDAEIENLKKALNMTEDTGSK